MCAGCAAWVARITQKEWEIEKWRIPSMQIRDQLNKVLDQWTREP